MRPHTRPPRARTAPLRRLASRPPQPSLDDAVGASGRRERSQQPSDLVVRVRQDHRPRPLVLVAGELDVATAELVSATLDHVRRTMRRRTGADVEVDDVRVDVDLLAVTFADSHGLAPLLGRGTRIVAASRAVRCVLLQLHGLPAASHVRPAPAARGWA